MLISGKAGSGEEVTWQPLLHAPAAIRGHFTRQGFLLGTFLAAGKTSGLTPWQGDFSLILPIKSGSQF